jgi:hypothetical protein
VSAHVRHAALREAVTNACGSRCHELTTASQRQHSPCTVILSSFSFLRPVRIEWVMLRLSRRAAGRASRGHPSGSGTCSSVPRSSMLPAGYLGCCLSTLTVMSDTLAAPLASADTLKLIATLAAPESAGLWYDENALYIGHTADDYWGSAHRELTGSSTASCTMRVGVAGGGQQGQLQ